jgi:hypothetical protein
MVVNPSSQTLHEELALTRAEEAKALRRALHFLGVGSVGDALNAMRDAESIHSRISRLDRELRKLRDV